MTTTAVEVTAVTAVTSMGFGQLLHINPTYVSAILLGLIGAYIMVGKQNDDKRRENLEVGKKHIEPTFKENFRKYLSGSFLSLIGVFAVSRYNFSQETLLAISGGIGIVSQIILNILGDEKRVLNIINKLTGGFLGGSK
jgi:drug/metabolite transporter (DMT)-like permease